ncbi:MAG: family 10 glycosylhydrolase, partial [Gemmatimonadaceae bacterium]|nr:family 10 glycosylhydrolase [Gemmatimonadaceae bacterium]
TAWADMRRAFVSAAVREVRDSLRVINPKLVLSAAVWPIWRNIPTWPTYSRGYDDYFQDPRAWAREGTLDVAAPMTYPASSTSTSYVVKSRECDPLDWVCLLVDHKNAIEGGAGRHVYIGVGAIKGKDETLLQIQKGREKGTTGFSVYSFSQVDAFAGWSILGDGPFRYPATIPVMSWK